jgi:hypothetical protein
MSYVPGFRYDLFVSYASEDNQDGWVEHFQSRLTAELARLLGRPFSDRTVYFDKLRLKVGQAYPEELDKAARDSALLVVLLSPSYSTSDWCSRERHEFQKRLPAGGHVHECLAVVRLRPTGALPQTLVDAQRADFVIQGFQEPWLAGSGKWLEIVNHVATDIKDALQKLRNRCGAVFVGPTLRSHMDLRANLAEYLSEHHFRTTPDPAALLDDSAATQQALVESVCALHFLGGATDQALEALELSTRLSPGPTIIFQPFGAELTEGERFVIDNLPPEHYPHRIGPNETELKKFLADLLTRTREATAAMPAPLGLVCDASDFAWAQQFSAPGLSFEYPRFLQEKLTNMDRLRRLRELVRERHGLLFYHGRSDRRLLDTLWKLADEEQSRAARRWYLDEPELDVKRKERPADSPYPEGLDSFLDEVRRRAAGGS